MFDPGVCVWTIALRARVFVFMWVCWREKEGEREREREICERPRQRCKPRVYESRSCLGGGPAKTEAVEELWRRRAWWSRPSTSTWRGKGPHDGTGGAKRLKPLKRLVRYSCMQVQELTDSLRFEVFQCFLDLRARPSELSILLLAIAIRRIVKSVEDLLQENIQGISFDFNFSGFQKTCTRFVINFTYVNCNVFIFIFLTFHLSYIYLWGSTFVNFGLP